MLHLDERESSQCLKLENQLLIMSSLVVSPLSMQPLRTRVAHVAAGTPLAWELVERRLIV